MPALKTVETVTDYIDFIQDVTELLKSATIDFTIACNHYEDARYEFAKVQTDRELSVDGWRQLSNKWRAEQKKADERRFDELKWIQFYGYMIDTAREGLFRKLLFS